MAVLPYETEPSIRKRYKQQEQTFQKQKQAEADRAREQYNTSFDTAQRRNYVNYMQSQKDLPEQLARQGITGGMSETANVRNRLNYENIYAGTEGQRQSAIRGVNDQYADALYNYRTQADANMNTELGENRRIRSEYEQQRQQQREERFVNNIGAYDTIAKVQAGIEFAKKNGLDYRIPYLRQQAANIRQQGKAEKQAKQERYEQRYANTISGYNSIDGINKEIKRIQKSGKNTWRIAYLRARRTELQNEGLEGSGSSGYSGGGYYGGYSSGGGGGGGGNSQTETNPETEETPHVFNGKKKKPVAKKYEKAVKKSAKKEKPSLAGKAKGRSKVYAPKASNRYKLPTYAK